jgi:Enoyl-CoA hydratase/carnithine racemase
MTGELLLAERRAGAVLIATLNRPAKGNALNLPLLTALDELAARLERAAAGNDPVRALVITGAGQRAFSAGADVADLDGLSRAAAHAQMRRGQEVFNRIERLPVPVIAAINGFALGGGLELAMSADIRIAAPGARLGQPEITLANVPGWGGTQRLPRLIGRGRALELILTGELIDAARAYQIGLVNQLTDDPLAAAVTAARAIAAHSPVAVAAAKHAVHTGLNEGMAAGLLAEADAVATCCQTEAQHAAVHAFLQRGSRSR